MITYLAKSRPSNIFEYLSNMLAFLKYHNDVRNNTSADYLETENETLSIPGSSIHYTIGDISTNGSIPIRNGTDALNIIGSIDSYLVEEFLGVDDNIGILGKGVIFALSQNDKDLTDIISDHVENEMVHIPLFDWEKYSVTAEVIRKSGKHNIYLSLYRSYKDIRKILPYVHGIVARNKDELEVVCSILYYRKNTLLEQARARIVEEGTTEKVYRLEIDPTAVTGTRTLRSRLFSMGASTGAIESPLFSFLLPSYGKDCGISRYHMELTRDIYVSSELRPICLTFKRLDDIQEYSDTLYLHHEYLLYQDPYLSENTHTELENCIRESKNLKFVILFHSAPAPDKIADNQIGMTIGRMMAMPNVVPVVFNREMAENIQKLSGMTMGRKTKKVYISDLGLYKFPLRTSGNPDGKVMLMGFNAKAKDNQAVIEYLLENTQLEFVAVGCGTSVLAELNPSRIEVVDQFVEDSLLLEIMNRSSCMLCNRGKDASASASASYRYAVSLGLPVIASDSPAHTSLRDFTGEGRLEYYSSPHEVSDMVEQFKNKKIRDEYFEMTHNLVQRYSMGRMFLDLVRRIS